MITGNCLLAGFDNLLPYRSTLASKIKLPEMVGFTLPTYPEYPTTQTQAPTREIKLQRNTFRTVAFPFVIFDFGNDIVFSFGYDDYLLGQNFIDTKPFTGVQDAFIRFGRNQVGIVVDATVAYFPDNRTINNQLIAQMINSYGRTFDAFLGSRLIFHGYPFPTVISIGADVAVCGGIGAIASRRPNDLPASSAIVGVTPGVGATHHAGSFNIGARLQGPGNFKVSIEIPRDVSFFEPYQTNTTPPRRYYYLWGGFLTVTVKITRPLGTIVV